IRYGWPGAIGAAAGFIIVAGLTTARPSAAVRDAIAARGIADALTAFDGDRVRTLDYARLRRADAVRLRELTTLSQTPQEAKNDYATLPTPVAAGRYEVQIWFNSLHAREGDIVVTASRARLAATAGPLSNPTTILVEVPVPTRSF